MNNPDRHETLTDAVRDAVESRKADAERLEAAALKSRRNPVAIWALLFAGWAMLGWIWIARPAWLFGPVESAPYTASESAALTRFGLYLQQARIEKYAGTMGTLPSRLEDAGQVVEGVSYQPTGDSYVLTGTRDTLTLRFVRGMDADSFLGASIEVLSRRQ